MTVETKLVTAEELLRMPDEGVVELIDGEIRKMSPAGSKHGRIAARIQNSLGPYVDQKGLGETFIAEAGFLLRRNPDTVRAPDVSFVRKERWNDPDGYFVGPPDLLVEVISPSDTYTEVDEKVLDWLRAGVQIVIVINPRNQTAAIHRSLTESMHIDINGALDGGTVIPGWNLPLRDLFVP
jgi:Uma2 family endonuclease